MGWQVRTTNLSNAFVHLSSPLREITRISRYKVWSSLPQMVLRGLLRGFRTGLVQSLIPVTRLMFLRLITFVCFHFPSKRFSFEYSSFCLLSNSQLLMWGDIIFVVLEVGKAFVTIYMQIKFINRALIIRSKYNYFPLSEGQWVGLFTWGGNMKETQTILCWIVNYSIWPCAGFPCV